MISSEKLDIFNNVMIIEVKMLEACYTLYPFTKGAKLYDQDTSISTLWELSTWSQAPSLSESSIGIHCSRDFWASLSGMRWMDRIDRYITHTKVSVDSACYSIPWTVPATVNHGREHCLPRLRKLLCVNFLPNQYRVNDRLISLHFLFLREGCNIY